MILRVLGAIVIAVLAFWLIGRILNLLGSLIVVALLVGAILVVYNFAFAKRRTF
ncbi:MAG: hypothetical protein U0232_15180 [Thermomicrobiales bacterium]